MKALLQRVSDSLSYNTSKESIDAYSVLPADHEKKTADLLAEVARLNGTAVHLKKRNAW